MSEETSANARVERIAAPRQSLGTVLIHALAACGLLVVSGHASANAALAQKSLCMSCHQAAVKVLGPSWKDIGGRYGEGKGTVAQLAASIKTGSAGKWGAMPMPPQKQVSDADAQALAQWLLDGAR